MAGQATDGIDAPRVEEWFLANAGDVEPPLRFERIAGGRSNLTYSVADAAGRRWALRRPPLGKRLASAHDMGREYRIISALGETPVPVPPAVGLSEEGADPFYVMGWVEGPILRSKAEVDAFPEPADRRAIGERVVDTLVAIHDVDPDERRARRAGEEGGLRRPPAAPLARTVAEAAHARAAARRRSS